MSPTHRRTATVDGHEIFYREAGPAEAAAIVLLHGYPTSSFMFRHLIPLRTWPRRRPSTATASPSGSPQASSPPAPSCVA
jgi:pimeloyl-ACP methyl ester carboxylesterase